MQKATGGARAHRHVLWRRRPWTERLAERNACASVLVNGSVAAVVLFPTSSPAGSSSGAPSLSLQQLLASLLSRCRLTRSTLTSCPVYPRCRVTCEQSCMRSGRRRRRRSLHRRRARALRRRAAALRRQHVQPRINDVIAAVPRHSCGVRAGR